MKRRQNENLIELTINLNNSGSGADNDVDIAVYVGDDLIKSEDVLYGQETYTIEVTAKKDAKIKAVVSDTQVLPRGVYFYAPKEADANGDGDVTSQEVSQNLVGVAMGKTAVEYTKTLKFNDVYFQKGSVSDISYMYIDKETDEVDYAGKVYMGTRTTSAPIITDDSCVSVIFMNYSKSGMLWFSE